MAPLLTLTSFTFTLSIVLPMSPDDFYADPERHLPALYERFLAV